MLAPELVDEAVHGDDLACAHEQEAEKSALLLTAERDGGAALSDDLERAEDPELEHLGRLYHPAEAL